MKTKKEQPAKPLGTPANRKQEDPLNKTKNPRQEDPRSIDKEIAKRTAENRTPKGENL